MRDAAINKLWAVACDWADQLVCAFGDADQLANTGLSRHLALGCRNWLWSIEGLVRRLLIAAALAFDIGKLAPLRAAAHPPAPRVSARLRLPRFVIFAFAPPHAPRRSATASSQSYTHVPFPADDLLRIGEPRPRLPAAPSPAAPAYAPRPPHPLRRHGRIPRGDPEFRLNSQEHDRRPTRQPAPGPRMRRPSPRVSMLHHLPDLTDWRRVQDEWARTLPAPQLAARVAALMRVIDQPARWVRRLARRLRAGNMAARLAAHPPPRLRRPRLDRTPPPPLQRELAEAHHLYSDTS